MLLDAGQDSIFLDLGSVGFVLLRIHDRKRGNVGAVLQVDLSAIKAAYKFKLITACFVIVIAGISHKAAARRGAVKASHGMRRDFNEGGHRRSACRHYVCDGGNHRTTERLSIMDFCRKRL
jgi:hypothetical protein